MMRYGRPSASGYRQDSDTPLYDRICKSCGWLAVDILEPIDWSLPCPDCGKPTERAWLTKGANVIGDECDFVSRNGSKTPIRFRSKAEHKRWLKENGYRVMDGHVGEYGSDKSKHSTRWATGGKQWLADAEELARRNGTASGNEPGEKPFHIRWSSGTLTPQQVEEYRAKVR